MIKFINPAGHLVAVAEMQMPTSEMADRNGRTQAARMLRIFNITN
jgi:hypothetical protein